MVKEFDRVGSGHGLLPREIVTAGSIDNSMILDMAMGGSTNTVLHILAVAHEAGVPYDIERINTLSRRTPNVCKVAPSSSYHVENVHNSGGVYTILGAVRRGRPDLLHLDCPTVTGKTLGENIDEYDIRAGGVSERGIGIGRGHARRQADASGHGRRSPGGLGPRSDEGATRLRSLRLRPRGRECLQRRRRAGHSLRQPRPARGRGEDCRREEGHVALQWPGGRFRIGNRGLRGHRQRPGQGGRRRRDPLRRPPRRAGHAGDACPHHGHQGRGAGRFRRLGHRRPFLRRHGRGLHRPRQSRGRRRRADRLVEGWRYRRHRHPWAFAAGAIERRGVGRPGRGHEALAAALHDRLAGPVCGHGHERGYRGGVEVDRTPIIPTRSSPAASN